MIPSVMIAIATMAMAAVTARVISTIIATAAIIIRCAAVASAIKRMRIIHASVD